MSIALSPAPVVNTAPAAPANVLAAQQPPAAAADETGGAGAGATAAPTAAGDSAATQFQRALQRLLLGVGTATDDPTATAAPAGSDAADSDKDSDTAQPPASAPVADLLLSGMLLPPPLTLLAPTDSAAPSGTAAAAIAVSAAAPSPARAPMSAADAAALLATVGATAAEPAVAPATAAPASATSPAAPNVVAAGLDAAALLPATPAANRFTLPQAGVSDDAPDPSGAADANTGTAAPLRRTADLAAALAPLAAPAADSGSPRDPHAGNRSMVADTSGLDAASGAVAASGAAGGDTAARGAGLPGTPAATGAGGPHSLVEALGDRIALQLQRGSERAVIRLDPPQQGTLEITIHRDAAGMTQIHLNASSSDVVRQLQTISDSLRQELAHRQTGEVSVLVSQGGREQDGRQRQQPQALVQDEPGRALSETDDGRSTARFALSSQPD